jgi:hypothetical protein
MTATTIPSMLVEDVELRVRPSFVRYQHDPMRCEHVWEPHLWDTGRAYCHQCGSFGRWVNDPRLEAAS